MRTIYLDNNATTAMAPDVFDAMRPYALDHYGNASGTHRLSAKAAVALSNAHRTMARALGCDEGEVVVTSCGTESDNTAIRGVLARAGDKRHVVTTAVEHPAVLGPLRRLEEEGAVVLTVLGVDRDGRLDLDAFRDALRDDTALVSVMLANNETGVFFPVAELAAIARERGVPVHTDAVQAMGKIPIDLAALPVDLLALSAHKFHGPKGIGVLFVRKGTELEPAMLGGGQERGRRPGTENVAGIVAMAMAMEQAVAHLDRYQTETRRLRDTLERGLLEAVPDAWVNGAGSERLPNTLNIGFRGIDSHAMLVLLDEVGVCASAGSACKSGSGTTSPVLAAMGLSPEDARACARFSLSVHTTEEDIAYVLDQVPGIVARMRASRASSRRTAS